MNDTDKARAFELLRALGVAEVEVEFSGGNDEGGADDHTFTDADGKAMAVEVDNDLAELLEAPIYDTFGGFDGWVDISGTLTWDVTAGTVKLEHSATEWVEQPAINF